MSEDILLNLLLIFLAFACLWRGWKAMKTKKFYYMYGSGYWFTGKTAQIFGIMLFIGGLVFAWIFISRLLHIPPTFAPL